MPVSMGQPTNSFPHRQYLITPIQHSIFPFHLPINVEFFFSFLKAGEATPCHTKYFELFATFMHL